MLVTPDDIAILRHLQRHRFLSSVQICRLLSRPPKKIVERLATLFHNGYVDRPPAQREYFTPGSRPPYIYALGNRGAAILAELGGAPPSKVDWTDKNREVGRPFIQHALLVADIAISFERAPKARPDVRLITPSEILERAPEATRRSDAPWKWQAHVPASGGVVQELALVPDAVLGLDFTLARKRSYFFIEADRATMPIVRSSLQQTSMHRKFVAYLHGHRARHHVERYNIGNFRVLTVTTSRQRLNSMVDAVKSITGGAGSNLFLFADMAALQTADTILKLPWTSGKGETVTLDT